MLTSMSNETIRTSESEELLAFPPQMSDAVEDTVCSYIFEGLPAWRDVTTEKASKHIKEIVAYLNLDSIDLARILVVIRRYLKCGHQLRDVLHASEVFHYATFASLSHEQDVNVGTKFWSHITAKRFFEFYEEVLGFLDSIQWKLTVTPLELNRTIRNIISSILRSQPTVPITKNVAALGDSLENFSVGDATDVPMDIDDRGKINIDSRRSSHLLKSSLPV